MPSFNFSKLSAIELQKFKITHAEIQSGFDNSNAIWYPIEGFQLSECYLFFIGFTHKFRFLLVALNYNPEADLYVFHKVTLANEEEIQELYCKGRFSRISKRNR
jgi:hypothetical protein